MFSNTNNNHNHYNTYQYPQSHKTFKNGLPKQAQSNHEMHSLDQIHHQLHRAQANWPTLVAACSSHHGHT
jgi:hypothetical protein